jgi:hypothetical protein
MFSAKSLLLLLLLLLTVGPTQRIQRPLCSLSSEEVVGEEAVLVCQGLHQLGDPSHHPPHLVLELLLAHLPRWNALGGSGGARTRRGVLLRLTNEHGLAVAGVGRRVRRRLLLLLAGEARLVRQRRLSRERGHAIVVTRWVQQLLLRWVGGKCRWTISVARWVRQLTLRRKKATVAGASLVWHRWERLSDGGAGRLKRLLSGAHGRLEGARRWLQRRLWCKAD